MKYLLKHAHLIIDNKREYLDGALLIDNDVIADVFYQTNKTESIEDAKVIDLNGAIIMPGFFETHTHGASGVCFDNVDSNKLDKVSLDFAKSGSTSFLASISYDVIPDKYDQLLNIYNNYRCDNARFVGLHFEGPFLNPKHLGIGSANKFINPDINIVKDLLNETDLIKQMTIAYELEGAKEIGKLLHENNIRVMCGHSDATKQDLDENVDGFTHLFNAMRGLHHRDETLINCAFENKWYVELIADGNHINTNVLKLVVNNINSDKIILVSDSSLARNLPDGEYDFMSRHCTKKDNKFLTDDGHLAGSVVSINDEMKVLYSLGVKYTDLLLYSSLNAFRLYGLDSRFGTLEKGKYADLVIMDDDLNIKNVYAKGKFLY